MSNQTRIEVKVVCDSNSVEKLNPLFQGISMCGELYNSTIVPYEKIENSVMAKIEVDSSNESSELTQSLVKMFGGAGWHFENDEWTSEAIWSGKRDEGSLLCGFIDWIHIQCIPIGSLPASRRRKIS
jgi:hypothetical protein